MAELDFDELDKAVNDLMSNVDTTRRNEGLDDPEDKVVSIASSSPSPEAVVTPQVGSQTSSTTSAVQTVASAPAALAVKRRGQFMDVMHPSSDMTTTSRPVKRDGVTITPSPQSSPVSSTPDVSASASVSLSTSAHDVQATDAGMVADSAPLPEKSLSQEVPEQPMPDPIDQVQPGGGVDVTDISSTSMPPESSDASVASTNEPVVSPEPSDGPPLTTPFLSDAKVEKRPLGANSQLEGITEGAPESDEPSAVTSPDPVSLPAELQHDVVAVESSMPSSLEESVTITESVAAPSQPDVSSVPAGGSIAQQYSEQASTGDQTNGSIFDTATYHQPISENKPEKKASPLKWILWFVLLLLIGAGAGVAYFYFTR